MSSTEDVSDCFLLEETQLMTHETIWGYILKRFIQNLQVMRPALVARCHSTSVYLIHNGFVIFFFHMIASNSSFQCTRGVNSLFYFLCLNFLHFIIILSYMLLI